MDANNEIINLILTMIDTHSEYGDTLNFTKTDIDNIIKKYNFKNIDCNELGWIILWKNKYITVEEFAKHMNVECIDNNFYMIVDSFDKVLSDDYKSEISALDWDDDWWSKDWNSDSYYNDSYKQWWDDYTEDTLKEIMKYCFKHGFVIEDDEMNENNTVLKNGKLYFNDQELVDLIDEDELDDLKDVLNQSISNAQDDADRDEVYNTIKDAFINKIGPFERKMVSITDKETKEIKEIEKIYIRLNFDMDDVETFLKNEYNEYDFIDENYGDLIYVLKEMDFFNFKINYDNSGGLIDEEYLNEITRDRLHW
jgi:hypothetical protein